LLKENVFCQREAEPDFIGHLPCHLLRIAAQATHHPEAMRKGRRREGKEPEEEIKK
jgi:hypothetical protein